MYTLTKIALMWERLGEVIKDVAGIHKTIDENKAYTPPAYSSTDEVNTGQKWIDGKDIYASYFSIPEDSEAIGGSAITKNVSTADLNYDTLIRIDGFSIRKAIVGDAAIISPINSFYSTSTFSLTQFNSKSTIGHRVAYSSDYYYGGAYFALFYTKEDPTSINLKTKKKIKKEENK